MFLSEQTSQTQGILLRLSLQSAGCVHTKLFQLGRPVRQELVPVGMSFGCLSSVTNTSGRTRHGRGLQAHLSKMCQMVVLGAYDLEAGQCLVGGCLVTLEYQLGSLEVAACLE